MVRSRVKVLFVIPVEAGIQTVVGEVGVDTKPGIAEQIMPVGHPGTLEVVVAVVVARSEARTVGETEPPPDEYDVPPPPLG